MGIVLVLHFEVRKNVTSVLASNKVVRTPEKNALLSPWLHWPQFVEIAHLLSFECAQSLAYIKCRITVQIRSDMRCLGQSTAAIYEELHEKS